MLNEPLSIRLAKDSRAMSSLMMPRFAIAIAEITRPDAPDETLIAVAMKTMKDASTIEAFRVATEEQKSLKWVPISGMKLGYTPGGSPERYELIRIRKTDNGKYAITYAGMRDVTALYRFISDQGFSAEGFASLEAAMARPEARSLATTRLEDTVKT
jgi:hypothetical protein